MLDRVHNVQDARDCQHVEAVAKAMIEVTWDGHITSVAQLAQCVSKANRFLNERAYRYGRSDDAFKRYAAIEAKVLMSLCSQYAEFIG